MTTLNSHLQLAMLNHKRAKKNAEKGFTLIELLITVVILGVLSAIALPNFLGVRDAADQKAAIASATALGKEYSTAIVADLPAPSQTAPNGVTIGSAGSNATAATTYTAAGLQPKVGDLCLTDQAATGDTTCTISVNNTSGAVTGAWSQ